ncbi:MAG: response regulator transcription factor [Anaerolineales bacterium]|nr:MAG: response regulator transcription factor [Anaerolineales bacterium]
MAGGGAIFSPGIAQKVLGYLSAPPPDVSGGIFDELTSREREILELIAQGKTNAEIATFLNLSPKTASNYISNVLLKVHATDRATLMLMALEAGLGQTGRGPQPTPVFVLYLVC